jgi:hypothetical protein
MCVVIRSYSGQGAKELFDLLSQRAADWAGENVGCDAPAISEGPAVLHF